MNNAGGPSKRVIIIALLLFIVIVGALLFGVKQQSGNEVTVKLVPNTATLLVDGDVISPGNVRIPAGKHTFKASMDGFSTYTKSLTVNDSSQQTITISLDPDSDAGRAYLDKNPDIQKQREEIGGEEFTKNSKDVLSRYPFIADLPLERQRFTINYGDGVLTKNKDGQAVIALYISTTDPTENRNAIRTISEDLGVDPSDIEIVFPDATNPFVGTNEKAE